MSTRAPQQQQGRAPVGRPEVSPATSLASLFTLVMLTFGVPVALYVFGHDLLPTTVVKPSVMWDALKKPDDGHLFLQGLYLAAWVGWLVFFLSVFLEIVGQVQHRAALRLPGLGWLQRGVGTLVTAAAVIVASPVAAMAGAPPDLHAGGGGVSATQTFVRGDDVRVGGVRGQDPVGQVGPSYTVRVGDSLWKIAQEQLGDPNRFAEIAKLNDGRRMPDGTAFHYTEFLQSGWVLIMPVDAHARVEDAATGPGRGGVATAAGAVGGPRTYTVRQGDNLSSIAKNVLGDSRRWDEIFELNRGKPQPGGPPIWRADLIWPGDVLILPDDAGSQTVRGGDQAGDQQTAGQAWVAGPVVQHQPRWTSPVDGPTGIEETTEAPSTGTTGGPWPGGVEPSQTASGQSSDAAGGQATASGQASGAAGAQASQGQASQGQTAQPSQAASGQSSQSQAPGDQNSSDGPQEVTFSDTHSDSGKTIGAIGGLLAAGLLTALGAKRLRKVMRRRPGQRVAMEPPDDWELEMRTIENPTGRVFIDAALRTLSANLAEVDRILPDITATVLKPHGLEVHLARMEPPVSPFYADPQRPGVWVCPLGAPLTSPEARGAAQAPYPALVSMGFDEGDDSVLVDLEATHGVSLLAPVNESVSVLRAMAVELATGTWADQLEVTMVGFGHELPPLFTPGCLSHTESLPRAVEALARWSATVEAVLDKRDVSLREARTYSDPELASVSKTHILLSAVPLDPRSAYQLRRILSGQQRTSVAVVAVVGEPDHLLSPWAVTGPSFQTPQSQSGGPGLKIRMQALRDEQYVAIVRDLSGADLDDEWATAQRDGFSGEPSRPEPGLTGPSRDSGEGGFRAGPPISAGPISAGPISAGPTAAAAHQAPPLPRRLPKPDQLPKAPPIPTPEPAHSNRFRIPVDDLFRVDSLPPTADETLTTLLPLPGAAKQARHALNPANLPQFDLVVTPWHGNADTETIIAVPNAAHAKAPQAQPPIPGLMTFAGAGSIAEAPPQPQDRLAGLEPEAEIDQAEDSERKPGQWQNAYWTQRKAARATQQTTDVDPTAMSRSIDILGPIDLSGTSATAGSRAADLAEVAAFVMLHPGCSANQIAAELWPGRKGAVAIRDAQVARLREWLGTDAYGEEHLQITPDGYFMGSSVSCDWLEFVRKVQAGELVSAIALVRGRPFEDAPLRRYGWAESLRHEMTALVIDTAHYVAEACLHEQNPRGAQNAAYRGLQAAPESELLYRDLLTALAALGDLSSARQHADTLIAYADREGIDLQSETTALLRDVLQAVPGA